MVSGCFPGRIQSWRHEQFCGRNGHFPASWWGSRGDIALTFTTVDLSASGTQAADGTWSLTEAGCSDGMCRSRKRCDDSLRTLRGPTAILHGLRKSLGPISIGPGTRIMAWMVGESKNLGSESQKSQPGRPDVRPGDSRQCLAKFLSCHSFKEPRRPQVSREATGQGSGA